MKRQNMFRSDYGVMVALDMGRKDDMLYVVEVCNETPGVVALKAGSIPVLSMGFDDVVPTLRGATDLPLIYDQQKMGVCPPAPELDLDDDGIKQGVFWGETLGRFGFEGGIVYPAGGPKVQDTFTRSLRENGVEPFILGRFTCNGHLQKEGGFYRDDMPEMIYRRAAESGVGYYIMPGNRPEETRGFAEFVRSVLPSGARPRICMPGFGKQGGTIGKAFMATEGLPSYAIIGPIDCFDISERGRIREHLGRYCAEALAFC
jgi:orotidine-5'-phosphate decarboxylase